jgi:hypothetical protein
MENDERSSRFLEEAERLDRLASVERDLETSNLYRQMARSYRLLAKPVALATSGESRPSDQ